MYILANYYSYCSKNNDLDYIINRSYGLYSIVVIIIQVTLRLSFDLVLQQLDDVVDLPQR